MSRISNKNQSDPDILHLKLTLGQGVTRKYDTDEKLKVFISDELIDRTYSGHTSWLLDQDDTIYQILRKHPEVVDYFVDQNVLYRISGRDERAFLFEWSQNDEKSLWNKIRSL